MIKTEDDDRRRRRFGFLFLPLDREKKGTAGKEKTKKKKRERESDVAVLHSLSLSFVVLFDAFSLLARSREFFSARFLARSFVLPVFVYSQNNNNSFFLKTKCRTTRSARRGDETHHETRERNERVGFARVIEGGASRGVLVAATRMAFGVEEFDAQSVAENRVGEIRESTVGVLLRVLSGDFSRVGDRG